MTPNDDKSRKRQKLAKSCKRAFWVTIAVLAFAFSVSKEVRSMATEILVFPGQLNSFFDEYSTLRESWLNARQWTGMYSSFPEGVVNLEDLNLSSESDVILNLIYSEERHAIEGYIYSQTFLGRGPLYPDLMLHGTPRLWARNSLRLDVAEVVQGKALLVDRLRVEREGPDGIVTVRSKGSLLDRKLRLAPDEHLTEDDLDFRSILERVRNHNNSRGTTVTQ